MHTSIQALKNIKVILFIMLLISTHVFAGTTGKIAGWVKDAKSGEALPGVNVYIEGEAMGAATDNQGMYYILNVPPGNYTLKAVYIGYAEKQVVNVRVQIDQTTKVNFNMTEEALETEAVIVVAERPVVIRDISNSQMNIEAENIDALPVASVAEAVTLQAGIESGALGIVVRGGSADETVFMVDGFSQNDSRSNYPYSAVTLSSVEEVQVQTGGFNAEYGQARSGLVNVVTKEGRPNEYNASLSFKISPAAPKHFGRSLYDPYSYFNRPFFDPDVMWTGTNNGAWDEYTQNQYPTFEGWNAVSDELLADNNPDNDLTPEGAQRLFEWYRRRQGDIDKPDYVFDGGFGGPVPFINKDLGNLRFFLSHFQEKDMFIFPLSRDSWGSHHTQLKLTSDVASNMKLTLTGLYGEEHSASPYQWTTTPTGYILHDQSEIANLTNSSNTGTAIPYMPGYFSPSSIYRSNVGIKFKHVLSQNTLYEARLQYMQSNYSTFKMRDRDPSLKYEIVDGFFVDEAPYGYDGFGTTGVGGMHLGGWMNLGRDKSKNATTSLGLDLTSQLDANNQVKTGIDFVYNDYSINSTTNSPSLSTWNRSMIYHVFPYRLGLYVQDKLEFEGFIANLGLRLDMSDPNSKEYVLDTYDDYYKAGIGENIESAPTKESDIQYYLSPRLGIAHPISENSKLYFNYGHFTSEPSSSSRFRLQREANGLVTYIGNRNLELQKTISYEVGYEHNLFDMILLKAAGYYKDVKDEPGWVYYENVNSSVQYYKMENNNYADIRGFELTLMKSYGSYFSGFVNYTYDVRSSGYFGLLENYLNPTKQNEYLREKPVQNRVHPRPYARANLDFHTPVDFGPEWLGQHILAEWRLNILADWRTGRYETYNPNNKPGVVDDVQWLDWYNVNLRLSKNIQISTYSLQFYIDVSNLFNFKYMSEAGFSDSYDRENYFKSLRFPWEEGVEKGNDKVGDYRPVGVKYDPLEANPDNDPEIKKRNDKRIENKSYIDMPNIKSLTFLNPRDIFFGIRISF